MKGFVYILKDERESFYIGSTVNVRARMVQRRAGSTKTTRRMKNPELVLIQEFTSLAIARRVERRLKAFKKKAYIEKIVRDGYIKLEAEKSPS